MKFGTSRDGTDWLDSWGGTRPQGARSLDSVLTSRIPRDAGRRTALARFLVTDWGERGDLALEVTGWGVWSSGENLLLYQLLRRACGDTNSLNTHPWHFFDRSEWPVAECFLDLSFYFLWDVTLYYRTGHILVQLSHDELVEVWSPHSQSVPEALSTGIKAHCASDVPPGIRPL